MKQQTIQYVQQINEDLSQLLEKLSGYSTETLKKREDGRWSVMDNLSHLMLVENLSVGYVKKKLSFNSELKSAGLATSWRSFLLSSYAWLPLKFKAPKAVSEQNFPDYESLDEVRSKWLEQRKELEKYLSGLPEGHFDKELYKHPLVGRMSLHGMVKFFEGHLKRHEGQINRMLKALN